MESVVKAPAMPTKKQVAIAHKVTRWYLTTHYRTLDEPGMPAMFCDPQRVGSFAVNRDAVKRGDAGALFSLLITTAMFQRLQDRIVMGILRGIEPDSAREIASMARLLSLVDQCECSYMKSTEALRQCCDLTKDLEREVGTCDANPTMPCHLKRHTIVLRRYGHFGKMPTSIALALREQSAASLPELLSKILRSIRNPHDRALALEAALSRAWRVSQKIASMFLSAICNPDIALDGIAPWQEGIDWSHFVVIDTNVDRFLSAIGYRGARTYDARREYVQALARHIDLSALADSLQPYNPRIVQQALYLFMSVANRKPLARDCAHLGPPACASCPSAVRQICPLKQSAL